VLAAFVSEPPFLGDNFSHVCLFAAACAGRSSNRTNSSLSQIGGRGRNDGGKRQFGVAPGTTRPEHLRFDAALVVPSAFTPRGSVGHQVFEGGEFGVTTHAGPFITLPAAYAAIFPRVTQLPKHQLIGLPAVEIYQTVRVNSRLQLNVTDICLPVVGSS